MEGISWSIVQPVVAALRRAGYARAAELDAPTRAPDEMVSGARADALLSSASRDLGDEAIGLTLAAQMPLGALGVLDYALCTSGTVREALSRVVEHYGLATQRVRLALEQRGSSASLLFEQTPGSARSRHWIEFSMAVFTTRLRQTVGERGSFQAELRDDPPRLSSRHARFFGVRPRFGQSADRLHLPDDWMNRALRTASGVLAGALDSHLRSRQGTSGSDGFLETVRRAIASALDHRRSDLEAVLQEVKIPRRTLQRELQRRNVSFHDLLDAERRERARHHLAEGVPVPEVSERLGFSEPSAFFRAYRRWTGSTPKGRRARRT